MRRPWGRRYLKNITTIYDRVLQADYFFQI